jgi:hypothetical protein
MTQQTWIDEQEEAMQLFGGGEDTGEALQMLKHSNTNRDLSDKQARLFSVATFMSDAFSLPLYREMKTEMEQAQMSIDNRARIDFKQISIEQWQGKLQAKKDAVKAIV